MSTPFSLRARLSLSITGKWVIILTTDVVAVLAVLGFVGLRRLATDV
ncbi:MAG TPA: hypothetical protein PLD25_17245 [Chloroflexota bacterium]|nr:hypothetical protein [Chloroflexota bacterium]HUM69578.1 hypothetical protein [Chloroflexota bacterium]